MAEKDINSHIFDEEDPIMDLNIKTELRFSKKNLPRGEMVPVFVEGKKEYVLIPLDIKDGTTLTVNGGGKHNPRAGKTGDLHVVVHIEEKVIPWKKYLIPTAIIVAAIAVVFVMWKVCFSKPEEHIHSWKAATYTEPKTCTTCGATVGGPKEKQTVHTHSWKQATYTEPQTCRTCGETVGEPLKKNSVFTNIKTGDTVRFGSYEQDNNMSNGEESIEWVVLDADDDYALLVSRYGIDCRTYHNSDGNVTWETCSLRSWLNGTFMNSAFSGDEKDLIVSADVYAVANPYYNTRTGNNTKDRIFLLSISDINIYFSDSRNCVCTPTNYAVAQGAFLNQNTDGGWWWLRTPGDGKNTAASINSDGSIDADGSAVNAQKGMVRPAMWVTKK